MSKKHEKSHAKDEKASRNHSLSERLGNILDIPADLLCGGCYMELRGQNELMIQGCRRIVGYTSEEIVLKLRRGAVQVRGRNMTCTSYHSGCVTIGGWIEGISFSETEGAV